MRFKRNVQELQVNFNSNGIRTQSIPLSFGRLKTLSLEARELNDDLCKIIRENPTITKLSLSFVEKDRDIELLKLFETLPAMKIFNLNGVTCSAQEVIYLLSKHRSLNKFRFIIGDCSKYDDMCKFLADQWQTSIDNIYFVQLIRQNQDDDIDYNDTVLPRIITPIVYGCNEYWEFHLFWTIVILAKATTPKEFAI